MKDRVPANPGRVLITPEDGSAAFYATMTRADNPTQEGDPLNKANLLKDATAALFGLGDTAVPDEVLAWLGKYNQYWWKRRAVTSETIGDWEFVKSSERNAYPDSGIVDNYEYQYLGIPFENAVTAPIFEYGSYIGTGAGGSSAPNSLTFDFTPRLVIICGDTEYSSGFADYSCKIIAVRGITSTDSIGEDGTSTYVAIEWTDKGLSWYSRSSSSSASILAKYQLNTSGKTYYYVAIG